ncbi:hypothetical protein predicted by Glimmer/Critica [Acetobacter senegalensis]|uniref:Uncharacterized protein n=1 Tax=Acetobacter senegalensis TaxID=446692 RepID=A0A0U5EVB7_9PROT|nr:hypothetical protein predicted by Glimmer/Critica [Acetobacter senegalensis]
MHGITAQPPEGLFEKSADDGWRREGQQIRMTDFSNSLLCNDDA